MHVFWVSKWGLVQKTRNFFGDLLCFAPPKFFALPVTTYMLLCSTLVCKKIARAPGGGVRNVSSLREAKQNRSFFCTTRYYKDNFKGTKIFFQVKSVEKMPCSASFIEIRLPEIFLGTISAIYYQLRRKIQLIKKVDAFANCLTLQNYFEIVLKHYFKKRLLNGDCLLEKAR